MTKCFTTLLFNTFILISGAICQAPVKLLTHKDTLFLSFNTKGEKLVEHKVKSGQTYFSISKYYGLTDEQLKSYNPKINKEVAKDDIITVKIPNSSITRFQKKNFVRWKFAPICYKVKKGDNLFNIAKTHFKMPIDSIKKKNNITTEIHEGMVLNVGWFNLDGVKTVVKTEPDPKDTSQTKVVTPPKVTDKLQEDYSSKFMNQGGSVKTIKGKAFWQKNSYRSNDYLCMHRKARVNSYVRFTNPMNGKIAYAKVTARMNDKSYSEQVMVVLSPSLAKYLGAVDQNFFIKMEYL
jgi:LysM domain